MCVFYYIDLIVLFLLRNSSYSFLFVALRLFASCLQFRQLGTNAGEALGAAGIGVYGKQEMVDSRQRTTN